MKKKFFVLAFFTLFSFQTFANEGEINQKGKLILYRPYKLYGMAVDYRVIINTAFKIDIGTNEYIEIDVTPGEYLIYSQTYLSVNTGGTWDATLINIKPNETIYLKPEAGVGSVVFKQTHSFPNIEKFTKTTKFERLN